jgi:hypothetical protein
MKTLLNFGFNEGNNLEKKIFFIENLRIFKNTTLKMSKNTIQKLFFKKCQYAYSMPRKYLSMNPEGFGLNRNSCRDNQD